MASPQRALLTLEVELAADPIQGRIRGELGSAQPFAGWLQLAQALEAALALARGRAGHQPPGAPTTPAAPGAPVHEIRPSWQQR